MSDAGNVIPFRGPQIKLGAAAAPYVKHIQALLHETWKGTVPLPNFSVMRRAQSANPFTFVVVTEPNGILRGVVQFYAFKDTVCEKIVSGAMPESELNTSHVLSYADDHRDIYVAICCRSLADPASKRVLNAGFTHACLTGSVALLRRAYFSKPRKQPLRLWAMDASSAGKKMIVELGFRNNERLSEIARDHGNKHSSWVLRLNDRRLNELDEHWGTSRKRFALAWH